MTKMIGNKGKKNLIKALSVILAVLSLAQFPAMADESKSGTSYPQQEEWEYDDDGKSGEKESFFKKHPILTAAGVAGIVSLPLWVHVLDEDNRKNTYILELHRKILTLEENYSHLCDRISSINVQLRSWDGRNLEDLSNRLDDLSNTVFGSPVRPGMRTRLDQLERSREDTLNDVLQQVARLSAAVNGARGVVSDPALREQMEEISENLSVINRQLQIVRPRRYIGARDVRIVPGCKLHAEHGRVYVGNIITRTEVNLRNTDAIKNNFRELCQQFRVTRGLDCGTDNERDGTWVRGPYEYFFEDAQGEGIAYRGARFGAISSSARLLFAKIVKVMYDHRNEPAWRETISSALMIFAAHGGHCGLRASSLIDQAYSVIKNSIDAAHSGGAIGDASEMDNLFSELKDDILAKAKNKYLTDYRNSHEPLLGLDDFSAHIEFMLGMREYVGGRAYLDDARRAFDQFTSKSELIQSLNAIVIRKYHEDTEILDRNFFQDTNQTEMSFAQYCDMVGKSQEDIVKLVDFIRDADAGEGEDFDQDIDDLKSWANGERRLKLNVIFRSLSYISTDAEAHGHPETQYWNGVKFLVKCFNEHYLENRE